MNVTGVVKGKRRFFDIYNTLKYEKINRKSNKFKNKKDF